jgi:hypothetical protein
MLNAYLIICVVCSVKGHAVINNSTINAWKSLLQQLNFEVGFHLSMWGLETPLLKQTY